MGPGKRVMFLVKRADFFFQNMNKTKNKNCGIDNPTAKCARRLDRTSRWESRLTAHSFRFTPHFLQLRDLIMRTQCTTFPPSSVSCRANKSNPESQQQTAHYTVKYCHMRWLYGLAHRHVATYIDTHTHMWVTLSSSSSPSFGHSSSSFSGS